VCKGFINRLGVRDFISCGQKEGIKFMEVLFAAKFQIVTNKLEQKVFDLFPLL
jgi:hypothetical protein